MHALDADALARLQSLLDEFGIAPAEGFEIRKQVDVGDVGAAEFVQRAVHAQHFAADVGPGERFAVPLVHRVDVLVQRQRLANRLFNLGGVGAHDDGRLLGGSKRLHAIFHARDDGSGKPLGPVLRP